MIKWKVALVENFGLDFYNFRMPLARYLEKEEYEICAIIPEDEYSIEIMNAGIKTLTYSLKKNSLNPLSFIQTVFKFRKFYKENSFSLIHSFRLQPNVLVNISLGFIPGIKIVNHVTGLGHAFTGNSMRSYFYRILVLILYQLVFLLSDKIVVQNSSDFKILSRLFFLSDKILLIEGSGIDTKKFSRAYVDNEKLAVLKNAISFQPSEIVITYTGRLLADKGILEFLALADNMLRKNNKLKFLIAGGFDENNPSCVSSKKFYSFLQNANIVYLGQFSDIRELLYITDIFILPTYREGFSRSILEAMSMEIPVITTNVPGAQDAVVDNYSGIIVEPKNIKELESATEILIRDKNMRANFGRNGRILIEKKYIAKIVFEKITDIYDDLLNDKD